MSMKRFCLRRERFIGTLVFQLISFFSELPYVEKLKDAMTEAAELAMKKSEIDYYVCYKKITAVDLQGTRKRGGCLHDRLFHFFSVRAGKEYFEV